jgi:hypothetical protein
MHCSPDLLTFPQTLCFRNVRKSRMGKFARLNREHNGKDQQRKLRAAYSGSQIRIRRRASCLIALYAALSNRERSAIKQLAP